MLNESGIAGSLREIAEHIRNGNLEQARMHIEILNFGRLQKPIPDPTKGPNRRMFIDPGGAFGTERVNATARWIERCQIALTSADQAAWLEAAENALKRWLER